MDKFIGKKILEARSDIGLTQEELAMKIEVSGGTIGHWEKGIRSCKFSQLAKIAEITGKNISWFFGEMQYEPGPEKKLDRIIEMLGLQMEIIKDISCVIEKNFSGRPGINNDKFQRGQERFRNIKAIPVFNRAIGSGYTLTNYSQDDIIGFYEIIADESNRRVGFIAPVSGSSMEPEIFDGSLVFIQPSKDFTDNDKIIALIKKEGSLTLKYARKIKHKSTGDTVKIVLQCFSDSSRVEYNPDEIEVQGIVTDWLNSEAEIAGVYSNLKEHTYNGC